MNPLAPTPRPPAHASRPGGAHPRPGGCVRGHSPVALAALLGACGESPPTSSTERIAAELSRRVEAVATITVPDQAFDGESALAACERIAFNPWQALPEHEPLGRMNAVRRVVYEEAAARRPGR